MHVPTTAIELLDVVARSNLLAPHYLTKLRAQIPPEGELGHEAKTFAVALINKSVLTRFQAKRLLAGHTSGFYVDKYRLLDLLGEGGMGKVYLAEQTTMKRPVALKIIELDVDSDASTLSRFTREARAVAKLRHPNVTQAYDFDQYRDFQFIAMEFVEGISLQELVQRRGPLPFPQAVDYVCQASMGLEHAQRAGLVHRDIKPGNLMVELSGIVKILDLGLVIFKKDRGGSLTLDHNSPVLGTADYISPEQALDSHGVDTRADVYSLGCVLYFLLTGSPPFPGKTAAQKLLAHQSKDPEPIRRYVSGVPQAVADAVRKMMAKDPNDRFQTPWDAKLALTPYAAHVEPPYDRSLIRFSRSEVEQLMRYGAEPTASTTRLSAPREETLDEVAFDSQSMVPLDVRTDSGGRRQPSAARRPLSRWRNQVTALIGPKWTARLERGLRSRAWVGGSCCLLVFVVVTVVLSFSGAPKTHAKRPTPHESAPPSSKTPRKSTPLGGATIVVDGKQDHRAIAAALGKATRGGRVVLEEKPGGWRVDGLVVQGDRLPNEGQITFEGAGADVVLIKSTPAPVLRVTRARDFRLSNVTIDGGGRNGPLIEIEGQASGVVLKDVTLRNFRGDGIRFLAAQGEAAKPIQLMNLHAQSGAGTSSFLPIAFRSRRPQDRTRHVRIQGGQFASSGSCAILVGQPVEHLEISSCVIKGGAEGVRFCSTPLLEDSSAKTLPDWRNVKIQSCTLDGLEHAILFSDVPLPGSRIDIHEQLFVRIGRHPIVVLRQDRPYFSSTILTSNNEDVDPKPNRAADAGGLLIPLK